MWWDHIAKSNAPNTYVRGHSVLSGVCVAAFTVLFFCATMPAQQLPGASAATLPAKADKFRYGDPASRKVVLDALFAKLQETRDGFVAQTCIEQIWLAWHRSGRRDIDDLLSRAKINASEGEHEAALVKLDTIINSAPEFAEGWNGRATVYFHMGLYEKSLADIDETLKREPRHFGALAGRGRIFMRQQKYQAALDALNEALRHNPHISERHTLVPALREKLGMLDL